VYFIGCFNTLSFLFSLCFRILLFSLLGISVLAYIKFAFIEEIFTCTPLWSKVSCNGQFTCKTFVLVVLLFFFFNSVLWWDQTMSFLSRLQDNSVKSLKIVFSFEFYKYFKTKQNSYKMYLLHFIFIYFFAVKRKTTKPHHKTLLINKVYDHTIDVILYNISPIISSTCRHFTWFIVS
jgi:hypothetical protein